MGEMEAWGMALEHFTIQFHSFICGCFLVRGIPITIILAGGGERMLEAGTATPPFSRRMPASNSGHSGYDPAGHRPNLR